jgi:hypothetical protein
MISIRKFLTVPWKRLGMLTGAVDTMLAAQRV